MLSKILAVILVVTLLVRLMGMQWKGMGEWFRRFVDITLVTIVVVYGVQAIIMLSR